MSKKVIEIIASEESYRNLSTFSDIKQLNEAVRQYKVKYADKLTNTAVRVLDVLHRYSAKYTGVSFMAKNTIAELIGVSRRTVIRVCQLLESLGIIKQYEMKRSSDMKQTSNAIVIQAVVPNLERPLIGNSEKQLLTENLPQAYEDNLVGTLFLSGQNVNVTQEVADHVTPLKQRLIKTNKQENNNNISDREIDSLTPIDKIIRHVAYKIHDAERRNGRKIQYLSSYVERCIKHEQRQAMYNELIRNTSKKKRETKVSPIVPLYDWLRL